MKFNKKHIPGIAYGTNLVANTSSLSLYLVTVRTIESFYPDFKDNLVNKISKIVGLTIYGIPAVYNSLNIINNAKDLEVTGDIFSDLAGIAMTGALGYELSKQKITKQDVNKIKSYKDKAKNGLESLLKRNSS